MVTLLDSFRALPEEAQARIMKHIEIALHWRAWDGTGNHPAERGLHAREAVAEIGEIFEAHGVSVEIYS